MAESRKILKQLFWKCGLVLLISSLTVLKAGDCFSNDNAILNSNYEYLRLFYDNDEEEIRRRQLQQLQLENESLTRRIKSDFEKQQAETSDRQAKAPPEGFGQVYCYVDNDDSSSGEQTIKCSFRKEAE